MAMTQNDLQKLRVFSSSPNCLYEKDSYKNEGFRALSGLLNTVGRLQSVLLQLASGNAILGALKMPVIFFFGFQNECKCTSLKTKAGIK